MAPETFFHILGTIGALTGGGALLWDILKWKWSRANLRVKITPRALFLDGSNEIYIKIDVVNRSDRTVTIRTVDLVHFKNYWCKFIGVAKSTFIFDETHFEINRGMPITIEPGSSWFGRIIRHAEIDSAARNGRLYCQLHHSARDKPIKARICV